jgi:hypothetical protein
MQSSLVPPTPDSRRRSYGRLAGVLFIAGGAFSVPASLLLASQQTAASYMVTVTIIAIGAGLYFAPWARMGDAWLHLATAVGTVTITASIIAFSASYRASYFIVLAYAAYVFESRRAVVAHTALAAAGVVLALAVTETGHTALESALIFVPALLLVTGLIAYLNEQLAASRDAYREFAGETIDLALRIRSRAGTALRAGTPTTEEEAELDQLARAADELHLRPAPASEPGTIPPSPVPAVPASAPLGAPPVRRRTHVARPIAGQPPRL